MTAFPVLGLVSRTSPLHWNWYVIDTVILVVLLAVVVAVRLWNHFSRWSRRAPGAGSGVGVQPGTIHLEDGTVLRVHVTTPAELSAKVPVVLLPPAGRHPKRVTFLATALAALGTRVFTIDLRPRASPATALDPPLDLATAAFDRARRSPLPRVLDALERSPWAVWEGPGRFVGVGLGGGASTLLAEAPGEPRMELVVGVSTIFDPLSARAGALLGGWWHRELRGVRNLPRGASPARIIETLPPAQRRALGHRLRLVHARDDAIAPLSQFTAYANLVNLLPGHRVTFRVGGHKLRRQETAVVGALAGWLLAHAGKDYSPLPPDTPVKPKES